MVVLLSYDIIGTPPRDSRDIHNKEIVGQATNIITSKLLKGIVDNTKNMIFSPFGYASILAILEEGAYDETNYDIKTVLKHPNDRTLVRSAYRSVLSHFQGLDPEVAPQFRSWFYIYKNNTANESFKEILSKDFYVTVRDVEPMNNNESPMDEEITPPVAKASEEKVSIKSTNVQVKQESKPANGKDIIQFDIFKMGNGPVNDETRIDGQKDASKFDEVVEDRQYVEVPIIKNEQHDKERKNAEANEENKLTLPIKQYEKMEMIQAEESRFGKAVRHDPREYSN